MAISDNMCLRGGTPSGSVTGAGRNIYVEQIHERYGDEISQTRSCVHTEGATGGACGPVPEKFLRYFHADVFLALLGVLEV